jgi:hypothetical protein
MACRGLILPFTEDHIGHRLGVMLCLWFIEEDFRCLLNVPDRKLCKYLWLSLDAFSNRVVCSRMYLGICISCRPHLQQVTLKHNSLKACRRRESYAPRIVCFSTDSDEWLPWCVGRFLIWDAVYAPRASNPGCQLLVAIYRLSRPGLRTWYRMDSQLRSKESCRNCLFGDSFIFDLVTDQSLTLLGIAVGLVECFIAERFVMSIARGRSCGTVLVEVTRRKKRAGWKI